MDNLVMVLCNGVFLMGKLDGGKILGPRIYNLQVNALGQTQHALSPLPGTPMFLALPRDFTYWTVHDKAILQLYVKATTGIELVN